MNVQAPGDDPADGEKMHLFDDGDELYASMCGDIEAARESIRLEMYLFAADEAGWPIIGRLCARARDGVRVEVRVDSIGSMLRLGMRARRRLRRAGVRLTGAPCPVWRQLVNPGRRDHRKLLIVDGRVAYLGGFNIHRQCSQRSYGARRWRDLHVRFRGGLVNDAVDAFDTYGAGQLDWQPARGGSPLLIGNHSRECRFRLYCRSVAGLASARRRIWIASPYFVPNRGITGQLRRAAQRGVDVRLQIPAGGDVPVVGWATAISAHRLAKAGVRVYRYLPRMNHAKSIVVDDDWASVGTANVDYRSLFTNDELNLISRSASLNRRLAQWFEAGFAESTTLSPNAPTEAFSDRPLVRWLVWKLRRWL